MKSLCSFCGGDVVALNETFSICRSCSSVFNNNYTPESYSDSYFTSDYKAQYGKTYEEDFSSIYSASSGRMKFIVRIGGKIPASLLDVGSALGFFLKAADDYGVAEKTGVEISSFACEHVARVFGYKCIQTSFDRFSSPKQYDAVTAWYFAEHTPDINLTIRRLSSFVSPGGVLALSLPCAKGPSFSFNRKNWFNTHPTDHSADITPKAVKGILRREGYVKIHVRPAAIHPERVLSKSSFVYPVFAFLFGIFSRITAYSDTIEVYALKKF